MLTVAGVLLAVMAAGSVALLVLGLGALVNRRWRNGASLLAAGSGSLVVTMVALAWLARSLLSTDVWTADVGPEVKARFLAENISCLMNTSALGLPAGLIMGILLVWRRRVQAKAR